MGIERILAALVVCVWAGQAAAAPVFADSYLGRLEAYALTERLNGELLAGASATATLEAWCGAHRMAVPPKLTATLDSKAQKPADAAIRAALGVGPDEPVVYRRVALACGSHVLSQAENWYVPSRLTAQMNRLLTATDTPFGRAIRPLHPSRQTLAVERLWSALPDGWEIAVHPGPTESSGLLAIPDLLFRHRAVVFDARHRPLAYVIESYTGEVLSFAR